MSDDAGTNDIIVFKNGCVWVSRHLRAYVVGQNPKLPKEELVQFTFSSNHYLDPETFYTRLEQSLLVFGYLALKG